MKCPMCEIQTPCEWLGGNSFECQECGWLFSDPKRAQSFIDSEKRLKQESLTCPYCQKFYGGLKDDLSNLNCAVLLHGKVRYAHPECIKEKENQDIIDKKEEENNEIIQHKQIELIDKVSSIPCSHCGKTGIYLEVEQEHYYIMVRPYWVCSNCEKRVDKKWLMTQIRRQTRWN